MVRQELKERHGALRFVQRFRVSGFAPVTPSQYAAPHAPQWHP